jgi:hypothetical protein
MRKEGLKARLFEALVKELVKKAGFREFDSEELTRRKKFHGRGATHQIDVWGEFYFSIPFIYPVNLLGEVKAYKGQVGLGPVRDFCGVCKDISEVYKIDTTSGGVDRYSRVGQARHTHCPAFFSLNGFSKNAEEYMFAQGINPITYENNSTILKIYKKFSGLINTIAYKKLTKADYKYFKKLELLPLINESAKKKNFAEKYKKLTKHLESINSYFGMLSGKFVINILTKKDIGKLQKLSKCTIDYSKNFLIKHKNRLLGEFSLSKQFIKYYLVDKENIRKTFAHTNIFLSDSSQGRVIRLEFTPESVDELANKLLSNKT